MRILIKDESDFFLFQDRSTITEHINNIFSSNELDSNTSVGISDVSGNHTFWTVANFATVELIHSSLSASYNIAARYYIRETLKPMDVNSRSELETKASLTLSGTKLTYNTFKVLLNVI